MKWLIKKILKESEFDWTTDLPAEDDAVFLLLTIGKPDWEFDEDGELLYEDPDWVYWNLYLYVTKQEYRDMTGSDISTSEWDEWNINDKEGDRLLQYFYKHNFNKKQKPNLITSISTNNNDGGFTVIDKGEFCSNVGKFHPDKCHK